ncbi:MAG: MlaD family protein [Polyangiales bacterium]
MIKLRVSRNERAAGVFVLAAFAIVLIFVVGAAVRNRWFHARVKYRVEVTVGDGLREGSTVFLSGVEVGEIGKLSILDDNRVELELAIWEEHAHRIRTDTRATARRVFGIGEKRIQLHSGEVAGTPLAAGATLPMEERLDLVDAVASLDLGLPMHVLDRTASVADRLLTKLDEDQRFDRMLAAFDRLGPTLEKAEALLADPNLRGTLAGTNVLVNSSATKKTIERAATLLAPERMDRMLAHSERVLERVDELSREGGTLEQTLKKTGRLLDTAVKLNDAEKLSRILDNTALLAESFGKLTPAIPGLTAELTRTLRETVVTLKALQKTWLLEGKADKARKELEKTER